MNVALAKEFQNRIVNASRSDLVIINYEMLIAEVDDAIIKCQGDNQEAFHQSINQGLKILRELSDNLDLQYEVSINLMSLYIYVNGKLIEAKQKNQTEPLELAKEVLKILLVGWQESAKNLSEEEDVPMMKNSQQVYAGLTYGKGSLNEMVYEDGSRGFKA